VTGGEAGISRRRVLAVGAGALGVAVTGAACGGGSGGPGGAGDTGPRTVPVAQVPVGSAIVVGTVVVSQPTQGAFKAFSAVCTHEGCLVSRVDRDTVQCPCHGSLFSTVDGSALRGPAVAPLAPRDVTVSGDSVTVS